MADIKQYVNLDPEKADELNGLDKKRAGPKIKVEATINEAKAGVRVTFELQGGNDNLKLKGKLKRKYATTNGEGKATVEIDLTAIGGEELTVSAYLRPEDDPIQSDRYIAWRRIYTQVSRFDEVNRGMNQGGPNPIPAVQALDLGPVEAELKARNHNIELVDDSGADLITRQANVLTHENKDRAYKASAKDGYDRKREPVTMRLIQVNQIAAPKTAQVKIPIDSRDGFASQSVPHMLWQDRSRKKPEDWLVRAEWCWRRGGTTWHALPNGTVSIVGRKIYVDLTDANIAARNSIIFTSEEVEVRVTYRYLAGSTNGVSWYNAIWLASSSMDGGDRTEAEQQQTAIHEIGHWLGMVPSSQSTQYTGHGHRGGHCTTGLSANEKKRRSYGGLNGTCVMFGENSDGRKSEFCATCDPSMRRSKARRAGFPTSW